MFMRMIYDERLAQAAYLIGCQQTEEAIVFDPQRDVERYIDLARANDLRITAVAETHIHADFLSGARELAERTGAMVYVSDEGDADWKYEWLDKMAGGGSYKHRLLHDGDVFRIGGIEFRAVHTPGHTPEHLAFLITDRGGGADEPMAMITGDFLFVGDLGRPDLLETAAGTQGAMKPSARRLFQSVQQLTGLADFLQIWPGHGSGSACGKALGAVPTSTLGYERRFNAALRAADNEDDFVEFILSGQPEPPLYFARMKRDNKIGPKILGSLPKPPRVKPEVVAAIDPREVAIIDTRMWSAFRRGHLPGSLSARLEDRFPTHVGSFVREDEPIHLVIDESDVEEAVRQLIRIGLDDIRGWFAPHELEAYFAQGGRRAMIDDVQPHEVPAALEHSGTRVLDVRRATEFEEGHIEGAINISHTRLASRLDEVPKDEEMLVICRSGVRSALAASYLKRLGLRVKNIAGGMNAWEHTAQPVA